jgi:hypothetical protein
MSFISDYLTFTANTESPLEYHQWACMSTLSALAGRRFWFRLGPFTYYPNLYVVLVGHPGVKKSAALDRAKNIIRSVSASGHRIPIAAAQATKEFIAKAMSNEKFPGKRFFKNGLVMEEYNQYAIFATELTQFISVNAIGMLDFLTTVYTEKVYDCDTKGQGSDLVIGPYITMLACLTPEMLKGFLKMNILTGGFARRTVFVYGSGGEIIPIPGFTQEQEDAGKRCVEFGIRLQAYSGEFRFGAGAEEWYINWYRDLHTRIGDISTPSTEGWYRTKHEILFKVAMLAALSEMKEGDPLEFSSGHLELVEKRFLNPIEKKLERVFEGSGINPNAQAATQICRMLEALDKPVGRKWLEGMFFDQVTDLNGLRDTINHLISVGRLAGRTISVDGQLLGEAIGTPGSITRFSDEELAAILRSGGAPPPSTGTGLHS